MVILLVVLVWPASLALFVALRAKATKSRLDRRFAESRAAHAEASRSDRGAVRLGLQGHSGFAQPPGSR
jgi:hypothetical protein